MSNVIEFTNSPEDQHGAASCWLCQRGLSMRSLFCHSCGTVQPVRDIDHFTRLGLERRIDVDNDILERQYKAMKKTLDPDRFSVRGMGERGHAAKQLEVIELAYEILRDPVSRGRYWIALHQKEMQGVAGHNPLIDELRVALEGASEAAQCDRVAQKACLSMQDGIKRLMQALRTQDWPSANSMLVELDGLESILSVVRERRTRVAVPASHPSEDVTRIR